MMTTTLIFLQTCGVLSFLILLSCYFMVRQKGEWAVDGFLLFFTVQYGPHTLWETSYHRLADLTSVEKTGQFLIGMSFAYLSMALGLVVFNSIRLDAIAKKTFPIQIPNDWALVATAVAYCVPFIAVQGPSLPVTTEYIRAYLGQSDFDYDEVRRELFAGTLYERLSSITRQTTTAILFSFILFKIIKFPASRTILIPTAILLFILTALQMNKFPFAYYFILIIISYLVINRQKGLSGIDYRKLGLLTVGAVVGILIILSLYQFQYKHDIDPQSLLIYRVFYCSSDALRLWYQYFPDQEDFLGPSGIPILASLSGEEYINPTVAVPVSLGTDRLTSFQVGFIGSGYAVLGFVGVSLYGFLAAGVAMIMTKVQQAFSSDFGATCFLSVLTINSLFLTTRELHTAMLSGGTLSVLIVFLCIQFFLQSRSIRK